MDDQLLKRLRAVKPESEFETRMKSVDASADKRLASAREKRRRQAYIDSGFIPELPSAPEKAPLELNNPMKELLNRTGEAEYGMDADKFARMERAKNAAPRTNSRDPQDIDDDMRGLQDKHADKISRFANVQDLMDKQPDSRRFKGEMFTPVDSGMNKTDMSVEQKDDLRKQRRQDLFDTKVDALREAPDSELEETDMDKQRIAARLQRMLGNK